MVEYVEFRYATELARMDNRFIFSLITNGTLIDEEIATFFVERPKIAVTISLDGVEKVNDKMRIYKDRQGTFVNVIRGLRYLQMAGHTNVSLSCTDRLRFISSIDEKKGEE